MDKKLIEHTINILKKNNHITMTEIVSILFKENKEIEKIYKSQLVNSNKTPKNQCQAEISSRYVSSETFKKIVKRTKNEKNNWVYFIEDEYNIEKFKQELFKEKIEQIDNVSEEKDLYPILMKFLKSKNIYSKRIDEKKSKNTYGSGGNKWLHPDIVGISIKDHFFDIETKNCLNNFNYNKIEMFSYEVKKVIKMSDVREYFFQAVSNSSWSNNGYLVATEIDPIAFKELTGLYSRLGIGFILLNTKEPEKSEIKLEAEHKKDVNWESIDRLLTENKDFKDFIIHIREYFQTGRIREEDWKIEDV